MENREIQLVKAMGLMSDNLSERSKMFQFLSIFHPEMSLEKRLKLANESVWDKKVAL